MRNLANYEAEFPASGGVLRKHLDGTDEEERSSGILELFAICLRKARIVPTTEN